MTGVVLIVGLAVLSGIGKPEFGCRDTSHGQQSESAPLYYWFLSVYADSLEHVAERHIEGGSFETATKLLVRVSYVRLRLDGAGAPALVRVLDKLETTAAKVGPDFLLNEFRIRNIISKCGYRSRS